MVLNEDKNQSSCFTTHFWSRLSSHGNNDLAMRRIKKKVIEIMAYRYSISERIFIPTLVIASLE